MTKQKPFSVLLVDDHPVLLSGMVQVLNDDKRISKIYTANDGVEALQKIKTSKIDIVVSDIQMPNMDGLELLRALRKNKKIKKVLFSFDCYLSDIKRGLSYGLDGYITKSTPLSKLVYGLGVILEGREYFCPEAMSALVTIQKDQFSFLNEPLTEKEREVICLLCEQRNNAEIASSLMVSENTVKSHRRAIKKKTGAHNLGGIIFYALEHGIFDFRKYLNEKNR